jgi:hypothetical protein
MIPDFEPLVAAVQANCHVSDARHAREMGLCTYLLQMRELYRWEQGAAPTAVLPQAAVGAWLSAREAMWEAIEGAELRGLPLGGAIVDPYDAETINRVLVPHGLVYGAGIGRFGKPQFFLATLDREEQRDGVRILVARREHARDLGAAPAACRGGTIYVRLESLRRSLWEKVETWGGKRPGGPLRLAFDAHGFPEDAEAALERMTAAEAEASTLHELGEVRAGRLLGPQWERMLASLTDRRAELLARAARDHLADCLVTLPTLISRHAWPSLHFWFANLDGMRQEIAPAMTTAYAAWHDGDGGRGIGDAVHIGSDHWQRVCEDVLALWVDRGVESQAAISALSVRATTRL